MLASKQVPDDTELASTTNKQMFCKSHGLSVVVVVSKAAGDKRVV